MARRVRCRETGVVFTNVNEAAKYCGLKAASKIRCVCCGSRKTAGGYTWEYVDDPDLPGEKWKWAKCITGGVSFDFTNEYKVSNLGRLKNVKTGTVLTGTVIDGYRAVSIRRVTHKLHRIVACSWIPNPENKPTVDHINTIRTDNRVENLRWFNMKEQMSSNNITKERIATAGTKNLQKASEVIKKPVICITTGEIFESCIDAANAYGIDNSGISKCCKGKWRVCGKHSDTGKELEWKYLSDYNNL